MRTVIVSCALLVGMGCGAGGEPKEQPAPEAELAWARTWGGGDEDRVLDLALLADGSVLAVGYAYGDVFGAIEQPGGGREVTLARFDQEGDLVGSWRFGRASGGPEYSSGRATAVAVGADGDAYVTGDFLGWLDFDGVTLDTTQDEDADAFVARISPNGKVRWARVIGGRGSTSPTAIVVDERGVVVAGYFDGTIAFAGVEEDNPVMDCFAARLARNGDPELLATFGEDSHDELHALAIDPHSGHYLAAGTTGASKILYSELDPLDPRDVLLVELDDDFGIVRSSIYGGKGQEQAWAIAGGAGTTIVAGELSSSLELDGAALESDDLDGFALGLDATGAAMFSNALHGSGRQAIRAADVLADGTLVVGGWGDGAIDLDVLTHDGAGKTDAFVALLAPGGEALGAFAFGDIGVDVTDTVVSGGADSFYAGGTFSRTLGLDGSKAPDVAGDAWIARFNVR